jgi:RecA/RadA recombinase
MIHKFTHSVIRTPSDLVNIVGCGGINSGTITELWGPPGCLAADTLIHYEARRPDGSRSYKKTVTIDRLFELFHRQKGSGKGRYQVMNPELAMYIPSADDEGRIFINRVLNIVNSGVKQCYLIRTKAGRTIKATADHKFRTAEGRYLKLSDLSIGDSLEVHSKDTFVYGIGHETKEHVYRKYVYVKHHPIAGEKIISGIYSYKRLARSRAVVEADLNGLSFEDYIQRLNDGYLDDLIFLERDMQVHHQDEDCTNDVRSNLEVLSPEEHSRIHSEDPGRYIYFVTTNDYIESMESVGEIDTYDIQMMGPFHNFVAQDFVVHNSGKSAFSYDTASMFLEDNPDGVVLIIDPELSTDMIRLEHVFKIDMDRIILRNARTMEDGFLEIYKAIGASDRQMQVKETVKDFIQNFKPTTAEALFKDLPKDIDFSHLMGKEFFGGSEKKLIQKIAAVLAFHGKLKPERPTPILAIWDTVSASKPRAEVEAAMEGKDPINSGGLGLRARVMEEALAITMSSIWEKPVTLLLLNQVRTTGFGTYRGPYDASSGGNAFKHAAHYRLAFKSIKKVFNEELMMNAGTMSKIDIEKSKFGPTIKGIPIYIDDISGGRIVPKDEAALVCHELKLLNSTGGAWYKFADDPDHGYTWEKSALSEKSGRWISSNPEVRKKCIDLVARHFRMNYYTLDIVYKQIRNRTGELNEEQMKHREELVNKFSFSPVITPDSSV